MRTLLRFIYTAPCLLRAENFCRGILGRNGPQRVEAKGLKEFFLNHRTALVSLSKFVRSEYADRAYSDKLTAYFVISTVLAGVHKDRQKSL